MIRSTNYNLTLQGGWNGSIVSPSLSGQTDFGNRTITIGDSSNPWVGNVTLNDFVFCGNLITVCNTINQTALTIYTTTGDITLSNVDVNNQAGGKNTALLDTASGDITVTNGTYAGNNSNTAGFSATTDSGSMTISDSSFTDNQRPGNNTYDGATLSAHVVTLNNVTATNNDGNGITITNSDVVTLNNVVASNNGTEINPAGLTNNIGSGVFVNGNAGSRLIIIGGTFNNNQRYGVEVGNPANTSIYIRSNPTCTGNDSNAAPTSSCYNDTTVFDNTAPVISPNVSGTAGTNGWYKSNVSVTWTVSDPESGILSSAGCSASNLTSNTTGTAFTCSASNNAGLSNSVSVTIKIDKTAPVLSLPANITTPATGPSGAAVTYTATATDNFDSSVTANCAPASGSTFSIGTTPVSCSSTDAAGNIAADSFQVTVQDTVTSTAASTTSTSTVTATATPPVVTSTPAPPASPSPAPALRVFNDRVFKLPVKLVSICYSAHGG